MAYIGRSPQLGNYSKLDDISASFNGSLTTFNMTISGAAYTASLASSMIVSVGGVLQEPETAYTVSGSQITFTSAPAGAADFFAIALGDTLNIGTPSDGTVTTAKLADTSVTAAKLGTNSISTVKIQDSSIIYNKLNANTAHYDRVTTNYTAQHQYTQSSISAVGNTFSWNLNTQPVARITLNADNFVYTIGAPTNMVDGGTYLLQVNMGAAAGSNTMLSWNGNTAPYSFAGNTYPTITANTGATDVVSFVSDGVYLFGAASQNYGKN